MAWLLLSGLCFYQTLAKLQRFKKSLSTKLSSPSSNGSKDNNEEDDSGWMATQLKFIPESSEKVI